MLCEGMRKRQRLLLGLSSRIFFRREEKCGQKHLGSRQASRECSMGWFGLRRGESVKGGN